MNTFSIRVLDLALLASVALPVLPAQDPDFLPQPAPQTQGGQIHSPATTADEWMIPNRPAEAVALPGDLTPIHTAATDGDQAYGIWAAGPGYKASFHNGMTFVPYLGRDYPQNQPLAWRTVSATVGAFELATEQPTAVHSEYRFEYRLGGIIEAYDVRTDGLEQTFVVDALPGDGDLVITGAVTTGLRAPELPAAHQALTFTDANGNPITRYGAAIAFDAGGRSIPLTTGYTEGRITLTVPGAWLANAALPVVVDPLLTRVQVITGTEVGAIDIGRDDESNNDNVMMAYIRYASATDGDLIARLMDDDYSGSSQVYTDLTTNWSTDAASCAFVGGADRWVIAMRRYFFNANPTFSRVRCHAHAKGNNTLETGYAALNNPGRNDWRPDVGGVESYRSGDEAIVVFQSENNGVGAMSNTSTSAVNGVIFEPANGNNGSFGQTFVIRDSAILDCERPSVNKVAEGGASYSWVCAMQVYNNPIATDDWDVLARRIDNDGNVGSGSWFSDLNAQGTHHQLGPVVEGSDGRYAVTFATVDVASTPQKTTTIAGKEIRIERFNWLHGANGPLINVHQPKTLYASNNRRLEATGLAYDTRDESHWVASYRSIVPAGAGAAYCARVGYNGAPTEADVQLFYQAGEPVTPVACVFDNDHDDFLLAYGAASPSHPIYGHTLEYVTTVNTANGQACSLATIEWLGNQQIGSEFNRLRIDNNGTPVGHFVIVAVGTTNLPIVHPSVFPGCRLLVQASGPGYLTTLPFQYGPTATYTIALPEWLDPMTFYFQDWMFDGTLFYGSKRLSVPVVK
ncbi:MAG: hypothetical protein NXI31_00535 [bacterium]|nr:hypothetical protein [bacterium]